MLNSCSLDGHGSFSCHPRRATGLPAFRIPQDFMRDARTAFATRCPPGRAERGWARVAVGQIRRHLSTCRPRGVTHGHASAERGLLHTKVIRARPTGMNLTIYVKPGILLKVWSEGSLALWTATITFLLCPLPLICGQTNEKAKPSPLLPGLTGIPWCCSEYIA